MEQSSAVPTGEMTKGGGKNRINEKVYPFSLSKKKRHHEEIPPEQERQQSKRGFAVSL